MFTLSVSLPHVYADLFVSMNKSKCANVRENPNVKWCITTFQDKRAQITQIPCMVLSFCKITESYSHNDFHEYLLSFFYRKYLSLMVLLELRTFDSDKRGFQEYRNIWPQVLPRVKIFPLLGEESTSIWNTFHHVRGKWFHCAVSTANHISNIMDESHVAKGRFSE